MSKLGEILVPGKGPQNAKIMLLGEAAGENEERLLEPFVGKAGQYLDQFILRKVPLQRDNAYITNAVPYRCTDKKGENSAPTIVQIRANRGFVESEIEKVKPRVIVAMGNTALHSLLPIYTGDSEEDEKKATKVTGITKWQGKQIWHKGYGCWVIPTFHPSSLMRDFYGERGSRENPGGVTWRTRLTIADFKLAVRLASRKPAPIEYPVSVTITKVNGAEKILQEALQKEMVAFDTESASLDRHSTFLGFSLCWDGRKGYYIPARFLKESARLNNLLSQFLKSQKVVKLVHNGAHDDNFLQAHRYPAMANWLDTMLAASLVDENFSKGLKPLTWRWLNFGGYDTELEEYKRVNKVKEYSEIPEPILAEYAGYDPVATFQLWEKFKPILETEKTLDLFYKIQMPTRFVLNKIQVNGFKVDTKRLEKVNSQCDTAIGKLEEKVYKEAGHDFNIRSTKQLQEVLYKEMGLRGPRETKTGFSCDEAALEVLSKQDGGKIAQYLLDIRYVHTIQDHFLSKILLLIDDDGRIRAKYNSVGTVTGRTSCIAVGTEITTKRGLVPIEAIQAGDMVLTHRGRYRRVTRLLDQGKKEAYRLTTTTYRDILCTKDHLFLSREGWQQAMEVKEVYCVGITDNDGGWGVCEESSGYVPLRSIKARSYRYRQGPWNHLSECSSGDFKEPFGGNLSSRESHSLFQVEDRCQKSNEGYGRRKAPTMEGCPLGQGRLSGAESRWARLPLPPCCSCEDVGCPRVSTSEDPGGASYRWGSTKQHNVQLSGVHEKWAPKFTPKMAATASFTTVGKVQVYDLVVEEDHSFIANGFIVHNCSDPPLHNIPRDKLIRTLFIPSEGRVLVVTDIKSAELRALAAYCGDKNLLRAFAEGRDLHVETYRLMFGKPEGYVPTDEERQIGKTINFALVYKETVWGLARQLKCSVPQAQTYLDIYFRKFPLVKKFMDKTTSFCHENGYVVSLLGRRRHLPEIISDHPKIFEHAERQIVNSPVQGLANDITNIGMIRLDSWYTKSKMQALLVHNVHDSIITDAPEEEQEKVKEMNYRAIRMGAPGVKVNFDCDVEIETAWGQHKKDSKLQECFVRAGILKGKVT